MRRKDRLILNKNELDDILLKAKVCQIAFIDQNEPYIVNMNYGYSWHGEKPELYFHSAMEGRKIELIKTCPKVCFSLCICDDLVVGKKACNYGMKYKSIVGYGFIQLVEAIDEKIIGLNQIMIKYSGIDKWDYSEKEIKNTAVIKLSVSDMTGKSKK